VGRTARNNSQGKSILLILKEESSFIETLTAKGIEIKESKVNLNRALSIKYQLSAMVIECLSHFSRYLMM
jgi:superfamily II DNA/RNA helicase